MLRFSPFYAKILIFNFKIYSFPVHDGIVYKVDSPML